MPLFHRHRHDDDEPPREHFDTHRIRGATDHWPEPTPEPKDEPRHPDRIPDDADGPFG
jgi:hypothetical protein